MYSFLYNFYSLKGNKKHYHLLLYDFYICIHLYLLHLYLSKIWKLNFLKIHSIFAPGSVQFVHYMNI